MGTVVDMSTVVDMGTVVDIGIVVDMDMDMNIKFFFKSVYCHDFVITKFCVVLTFA